MTRWETFQKNAELCFKYLKAEDLIHASHISLANKFLYVETAKVACSTIKKILIQNEYDGDITIDHAEYVHFREFSPLLNARQTGDFKKFIERKDIFKFCFVRNPYERLLSAYLDKIKQRKGQHYAVQIQLGYGPFSDHILTFDEFVNALIEQSPMHMDPHWRTQYYATFQNGIEYNFIGKFENFENDLKIVLDRLKIDSALYLTKEDKHATNAGSKIDDYFTSELKEKVYQKFKIDFEYFGYSK